MRPYFYILQHKTKKYYAGCKFADPDSTNLMTESGYQTSSKVVAGLIKEGSVADFTIRKIKHFDTSEEATRYECRFLTRVNAAGNDMFLNEHNGGDKFLNKGGYKLSETTKQKMRVPKSPETIAKQNAEKRTRGPETHKRRIETRRRNETLKHTKETKEKIRLKNLERAKDPKWQKFISERMKQHYKDNPVSDEVRKKFSDARKGKGNNMYGKKHSEETKEKMRLAWRKRKDRENQLD